MNLEILTGRWINSKDTTSGITEFELSVQDGDLYFQFSGAENGPFPGDLGKHNVQTYGQLNDASKFSGFQLTANIKDIEMVLAGNINKGLIIIALYGSPAQDSETSNFFIREFFYQVN